VKNVTPFEKHWNYRDELVLVVADFPPFVAISY